MKRSQFVGLAGVFVIAAIGLGWLMSTAAPAAITEAGHAPNRMYVDQDGQLHLNGSTLYLNEVGVPLGKVYAGVSASDAVTAVASNNAFVDFAQTYTIPASALNAGNVVRVKAGVVVTNASGTDTLSVKLVLGSTDLITTTAVDPGATTDIHIVEFEITSRAAASGTSSCAGFGRWITNTGGTIAHGTGLLAPTNFATNGTLALKAAAKWSSNTASTAARLELLNVDIY